MAPTAPVLAVLVCHDGEAWLPETLGALGRLTVGPRRVVAVDTGSRDSTPDLLRSSNRVDVVLDLPRDTPFGTAVAAAVADADRRWGRAEGSDRSSGDWLWVLHDDAAPEPSCLDVLLSVAEASPSAAMLGPLQLDWDDPRLVVEAGLSTDASGHRQTGIGSDELDLGQFATNSEVLAVGSAGALVRRREWDALGGYDSAFGLLREDLDLGWRVNRAGGLVLCVPSARLHHARAVTVGARDLDARGTDGGLRTTDRRNGMATVLVNGSAAAYAIGLVRLPLLAVLRAIGFLLLRRPRAANAELGAMGRLVADLGDLREARRRRRPDAGSGDVRGLLTSRTTRLRNAVSGGLASIVRNRVRDDLDLGRLPDWAARPTREPVSAAAAAAEGPEAGALLVGQGALPAGATAPKRSSRRKAGLRRPGGESVAVSLAGPVASGEAGPTELIGARSGRHRTAEPDPEAATALVGIPDPREAPRAEPDPRLVVVPVTPGRVLRELLLAPPLLMVLALTAVSLLAQRSRLGLDLAGGRLRVLPELGPLWAAYLAEWHPVAGGTAAPASAALAVVGVVGGLLWPVAGASGPAVAVSLLLLGALPLAGLAAYVATRPVRVGRVLRALAASVYALLGIAGAAVAQGRLDGVVVVVLLPLVLAGVAAVLRGSRTAAGDEGTRGRRTSWWSAAAGTSLLLAVVSAFAPLVHLMVLVVVVVGFVAVPAPVGAAKRRAVALAAVVVLPVLLLLPWPSTLLRAPQVLLHGTGSPVAERFTSTLDVLSLDPGGAGSLPVVGLIVLVAAVGGALLAPRRTMVPGLGIMLLGIVAAGIVGTVALAPLSGGDPRPGWTGPALAFAACGALWSLLALVAEARVTPLGTLVTGRSGPRHRPAPRQLGDPAIDLGPEGVLSRVGGGARSAASRLGTAFSSRLRLRASAASTGRARGIAVPVAAAGAVALAVCAALLGTGGPLAERPAPVLDAQLAGRLAGSGATVVEVSLAPRADGRGFALDADATRRAGADLSRYGDDDLVPVGAAPARLTRDVTALLSGDPATVQAGAAELAASGTAAVVLPDAGVADRAVTAGAPLLTPAAPTSDGRTVLTIGLPVAGAVVLEPPVSDDATDAKAAPRRPSGIGILPASPPDVGVLISPGADRRLVVLAAERESGWTATVGGTPADIIPAWGHLVGVPVPAGGGPVVVTRDTTLRGLLLLLQLALVLFTVLSALPSRTRLDERPGERVGGHR